MAAMLRRKVFIPQEIIADLRELVRSEAYAALSPVFENVSSGAEYLDLGIQDARNLLRAVDIEMSKAMLRYPHNEEDDPLYDPQHEERYDGVMMGLYEKTYHYVRSEFKDLETSA